MTLATPHVFTPMSVKFVVDQASQQAIATAMAT
jgi:hypothetical protein